MIMTFETLQNEMVKALKSGDKFRRATLSLLVSMIKKAAIDNGNRDNITDDLVLVVLKKERKNLVETVEKYPEMPEEKKSEYINQTLIIDEFITVEIANEDMIADILREISRDLGIALNKSNQGQFMKALKGYNVNMKVASRVFMEMTK